MFSGGESLRSLLTTVRSGNGAVAGGFVLVAGVIGSIFGLFGGIATIVGLAFAYLIDLIRAQRKREALREEAFAWRGIAAESEPTEDFFVKDWYGRGPGNALPPYVPRSAMGTLNEGLDEERFVILTGNRTSGKSRLIYEAAKLRGGHVTLVSKMPPGLGKPDPLIELMSDSRGFASWEERQILVIRGLGDRLASGALSGSFMREWLDRHPKLLVMATLSPKDRDLIAKQGEEREIELERLEAEARIAELSDQLQGQELVDARETFPDLDDGQVTWLPSYLVSARPLRERFQGKEGRSPVGKVIVQAVADWQRTGLARPAPDRYLRRVAPLYLTDAKLAMPEDFEAAFEAGLEWALTPVRGAAALVYRVGEDGFEADAAIVNPPDKELRWAMRTSVWREIRAEIAASLEQGNPPSQVAAELVAAAETAQAEGWDDLGRETLEMAAKLDERGSQYRRIAQAYTFGSPGTPDLVALVDSRRGEGLRKRYRESQMHATARRQRLARMDPHGEGVPDRLIAEIYSHRTLRTPLRLSVLAAFDIFSSLVGLLLALGLRALLNEDVDFSALVGGASRSGVVAWCALTVIVFALLRLYKQDAPRARLGEILAAMGMLGAVGLVAAWAQDFSIPTAAIMFGVAFVATVIAAFIDYQLRVAYDETSVGWVRKRKLSARTLLIGTARQAAAIERILHDGISRPTKIVGYLTTDSWDAPGESCLGTVRDLGAVSLKYDIGRVLIVDPRMSVRERQDLAGLCHLRSLHVEAIPSIAEVRSGGSRLVSGQSLVLHSMAPLWHGNAAFAVKRIGDFIAAAFAIAAFSLVWGIIALAILVFDGLPVLVRSWRPGAGRKIFGMYRFRTTIEDSQSPIDLADRGGDDKGEMTNLGRCLRSRGLDELPQLLNVLVGDMSLVGPRPLHLSDHAKLSEEDLLRYLVLPGITGPWQVCGRSSVSTSDLTKIDVAYLRHWTVFSDFEILVKSARLVLKGRKDLPEIEDSIAA
jgi:lipopolysaccharide/colanic/teichoic acid biosynthesis glycosyltransferase